MPGALLMLAMLQESVVGVGGDVVSRKGDADNREQMQAISSPR
jgi:hypothetical protein